MTKPKFFMALGPELLSLLFCLYCLSKSSHIKWLKKIHASCSLLYILQLVALKDKLFHDINYRAISLVV